jgi:DNA-directed RNA polymerase subunit alpha
LVQIALPKIKQDEKVSTENYGKFEAENVEKGFGVILGNSLRRVLLSSLEGAAVTSVLIEGITQEFDTLPSMKEDVTDFLLNIRDIRIRPLSKNAEPAKLELTMDDGRIDGVKVEDGKLYARHIKVKSPLNYEIVNPDHYLATLDAKDVSLHVEMTVERGKGYRPVKAGENFGHQVTQGGVSREIPVDAIFSPVTRANYSITSSGPGGGEGKELLVLEVWTDGTLSPMVAVKDSSDILIEQFGFFSNLVRDTAEREQVQSWQKSVPPDIYNLPIDKLTLSTHTYNSLRRGGIQTVGQLLEKGLDGMMALGGFGVKSREEVEVALKEMGVEMSGQPIEKDKKKKARTKGAASEGED